MWRILDYDKEQIDRDLKTIEAKTITLEELLKHDEKCLRMLEDE